MKAYVIKNKEGKYFVDSNFFTNNIICAYIWVKEQYAKTHIGLMHFKDCEVVEITIAEGDLEEENRVLKKAYLSACEKLSEVFGECPYSNMNLLMPEYCDEKCANNEKYLCWDKYFIKQAKGEKDGNQ